MGDDCDLTIAYMKGYEDGKRSQNTPATHLNDAHQASLNEQAEQPDAVERGHLIDEIDITLDYFYTEFPEEQFPQVWNDPICHFAGGLSPNDLRKIRVMLTDTNVAQRDNDTNAAIRKQASEALDVLCKRIDGYQAAKDIVRAALGGHNE